MSEQSVRVVNGLVLASGLVLALAIPAAAAEGGKSALASDPAGWTDILPGADLKGWTRVPVPPGSKLGKPQWRLDADKKMLVCDGAGGHDMLLYDKEFGDHIFHCEFRYVPGTGKAGHNSGIYVRNSADGGVWHQCQIGGGSGGYLFGETATPSGKKFFTSAKEVKDGRVKPVGEWNTVEMTAKGNTITVWVNGAVTCRFQDCGQAKGRVGVEGEGHPIEFRNLKVKELR